MFLKPVQMSSPMLNSWVHTTFSGEFNRWGNGDLRRLNDFVIQINHYKMMKEYTLGTVTWNLILLPANNTHTKYLFEAGLDAVNDCSEQPITKRSPGNGFQYLEIITCIIKFTEY